MPYQGKVTEDRSFTSPKEGNWEGVGPEDGQIDNAWIVHYIPIHNLIYTTHVHTLLSSSLTAPLGTVKAGSAHRET